MNELLKKYLGLIDSKPFLYEEYASWLEGVVAEKDKEIVKLKEEIANATNEAWRAVGCDMND